MFDDTLPKRRLGILCPLPIIDAAAYEFYKLAPHGVMAVMTSVGFSEYSAADVERALAPLDSMVDLLLERGIDLIMQSGVPLPLLIGVEAHDRIVERLERRTGLPASSTIISVCEAAKHLGLKRIVVANKWTDAMNVTLAEFLARVDVEIAGVANEITTPYEFQRMGADEGLDHAYHLARAAMRAFPQADGLFLGGQAWFVQPALELLESEFGKPVISNATAMLWDMLHRVDYWQPIPGRGRLLAGD
jgi:maleate isomerase/arylmalonate decarboxylase